MSKRPNRSYENDGKSSKVRSLSQALKERDREIKRLKQELMSLNKAFEKSARYMSSQSKDLSVEELIRGAEKEAKLAEMLAEKEALSQPIATPPDHDKLEQTKQETRDKIKKWREETMGKYEEE